MTHNKSIIWFAISLFVSAYVSWLAFRNVYAFLQVTDLLATIVSILTGVSLAVLAVLSSPFTVNRSIARDASEAKRLNATIATDDDLIAIGQVAFFWIFFASLALLFGMKFYVSILNLDPKELEQHRGAAFVSAITAFVSTFAFLWSARLPVILAKSARQRKALS